MKKRFEYKPFLSNFTGRDFERCMDDPNYLGKIISDTSPDLFILIEDIMVIIEPYGSNAKPLKGI